MYEIDTNFKKLNEEETKQAIIDIEEILNTKSLIKFKDDIEVKSFLDLLDKFFYQKIGTNEIRGTHQCYSDRRRSLIDFYLIQKYYLKRPMNFAKCYDIYFNKLNRNTDKYKKILELFNNVYSDPNILQYKMYYCSTVRRNVFVSYGEANINNTKVYSYKIKQI